jgi:hypothetical protein
MLYDSIYKVTSKQIYKLIFLNNKLILKIISTILVDIQAEMTVIKWKKSSPRRIKCNIDVTFPSNNNHIGFGICIRDETCDFIRAKIKSVETRCEVHVGEVLWFSLNFMVGG